MMKPEDIKNILYKLRPDITPSEKSVEEDVLEE